MKKTIGGERLGAGNNMKVDLKNYGRSTHDLSYLWRSTMASGTLVPFMSEVGLVGDSMEIDLNCDVMTHPTIGPLFGSYKVQLDVFVCPIRLYQGKMHMNMLNIGNDMSKVKLPQMKLEALNITGTEGDWDNAQINPSSLLSYLNIRGLGRGTEGDATVIRDFNAVSYLAYWDIYKNYYANKQEEIGVFIHNALDYYEVAITGAKIIQGGTDTNVFNNEELIAINPSTTLEIEIGGWDETYGTPILDGATVLLNSVSTAVNSIWTISTWNPLTKIARYTGAPVITGQPFEVQSQMIITDDPIFEGKPVLRRFELKNIDEMKEAILMDVRSATYFNVTGESMLPYGSLNSKNDAGTLYSQMLTQEGLGIKTYQSDLFNNWISTEWIDGDNGINEITAIDTSSGAITIDSINLANKIYNMLNRIAISGGSYYDWIEAVYSQEINNMTETPIYIGGLIRELAFEEVISNSATDGEPLGTLAGRGVLTRKNKGGKIKARITEPSYIIGIASLTPRIDYSQGNKWDTNLKTMDDFHKPALDQIGYQDLITDQMAWWDTFVHRDGVPEFKSAGKQPAWVNYMTNVNQTRGNFAVDGNQMFMTLNRRYEHDEDGIKDLTTYIDPSKFNNIFADERLDAQNFWVQISINNTARRKMSAKIMPNL